MRTYGRVYPAPFFKATWVEIQTDANGFDDYVWATTLVQVLRLNLGESPFYATWGLPAKDAVLQQVAPDYYVSLTQQNMAQYFASLIISRVQNGVNPNIPTYNVSIITHVGTILQQSIDQAVILSTPSGPQINPG